MKTPSENMSPAESLDLITEMIHQAKGNVQKNSFYFLLWGWVVVLANLGMFTLTLLEYPRPYIVWAITIPAWLVSMYYGFRQGKSESKSTHLDRISAALWICYATSIFTLIGFGYKINFQLNPVIVLFSAVPTFVSGIILRFKPLLVGAVCLWVLGIIGFLVPMYIQPLVGAGAIVIGYLVPGYILKYKNS
jgi:hypothetical protein